MTLLYFIFVLCITICIHELGHFIFAKRAGIYVYEFSIGMGPKIYSYKRKNDETVYSIRIFPIGGYVKMAGEEIQTDENIPENMRMQAKTWMQKFLTVIAGVVFNFLLAIVILFCIALFSGSPSNQAYIQDIYDGYPSKDTHLEVGDEILKLGNKRISSSDMLILEMQVYKGKKLDFTVKHSNGEIEKVSLTPKEEVVDGKKQYKYGISLTNKIEKGFLPALKYALTKTVSLLNQMAHTIVYLCTGKLGIENLSGPVGIYTLVGQTAKTGFVNILYLIALLCINVGFINFLPIPAFDGGRILFMIIEKIKGSPVAPKIENYIHSIFLIFLLVFMLFITCHDIIRLFS